MVANSENSNIRDSIIWNPDVIEEKMVKMMKTMR